MVFCFDGRYVFSDTFVDGRFLEFYPDAGDVLLWDHLTEELHRFQGGKWQNTAYRHREDE